MARKATKNILSTPVIPQTKFNLSDSFTSLLLGVVVVMAAIILFFSFIRGGKQEVATPTSLPEEKISKELEKTNKEEAETTKSMYTVVVGDTLWSISEKFYKSGFEWEKIAKANKIADPANLEEGTKITIPGTDTRILATNTSVEKEKEQATNAISGDSYTIVRGDDLWDIAIRAYGDGYKWVEIAKANNLTNPDLIHADNVLKLPR